MSSPTDETPAAGAPMHVIATAGHVDHGKSSLISRLTGIDPDRFAEEKRRGLTIDLGFAWCTLPSGREVGFVDVPGHERFVHNMLAGVGPVRLVLFVVAADEGWKPQSEEHLQILDALGVDGAVIVLTKKDLVTDVAALELAVGDVRERVADSALAFAPIVKVSSTTGEGLDDLLEAIDHMVERAPAPATTARPRLFVDRVFTVKGSGTVVTGTLTGGPLRAGDEIELTPSQRRARIRSLQTHKRSIDVDPVSRVAVNLTGVDRSEPRRGEIVGRPDDWRATTLLEGKIRPVRGLSHALTPRGAYKFYAGSAEREATIRLYEGDFARIRLTEPVALDVFDRFVLRESGRQETVAGGTILDIDPPARPGPDPTSRLERRATADRGALVDLLVDERGAVSASDARLLTGAEIAAKRPDRLGAWLVADDLRLEIAEDVKTSLGAFQKEHPLLAGADTPWVRVAIGDRLRKRRAPDESSLADALIEGLVASGEVVRQGDLLQDPAGTPAAARGLDPRVGELVALVAGARAQPPTVKELSAQGFPGDAIEAAVTQGALVRLSTEIVMSTAFVDGAREALAALSPITVSAFREAIGTSRKYAVPLLEYFDRKGVTRRDGDVRVLRGS